MQLETVERTQPAPQMACFDKVHIHNFISIRMKDHGKLVCHSQHNILKKDSEKLDFFLKTCILFSCLEYISDHVSRL